MIQLGGEERSVSPVIGVILMVAITVILAAVAAAFFTGFGDQLQSGSANAAVDFSPSPVGMEMTVETISTSADVQINGNTVATIDEDDAGRTILLPTSPGDKITIVSGDSGQSILVEKTAENRDEIGDFIAHYKLNTDAGSSSTTVVDSSNQNNDLTLNDGSWQGDYLQFDGTVNDGAEGSLASPTQTNDVNGLTLVVAFKADSFTDGVGQLFEYTGGATFELQPKSTGSDTFTMGFISPTHNNYYGSYQKDKRHVAAITYTGTQTVGYMNGNEVYTDSTPEQDIPVNGIRLGYDPAHTEKFDGKVYDFRMYYHAFDENEIASVTEAMNAG